ncbi:cellulose synthase operon protein YhjQ/BcsQ [Anaerovoracaceae bacterium 42-11]|nr:hypothetical protein [Emergencia sp.]
MEKVIGFFGGDHQVGATMVAQSFAEVLQQRGKKVLYLMGSGKFGEEFLPLSGKHSIDDLKASVRSGRVTAEDFYQNLEQIRGLWVLPGVRNQLTAGYFTENTFEVLLSEVSEDFDYVVIDGGSDANLGITISALNTADHRFFVTTQQSKSIRRMILLQKNIVQPLERMGDLVINKYLKDPALLLKSDILSLCEIEEAFTVPYVEYGWQAEMENKSLLRYGRFAKGIEVLADVFAPGSQKEGRWKRHFL